MADLHEDVFARLRRLPLLVVPLAQGHVSVAIDLDTDPIGHLPAPLELLARSDEI